MRNIKLTIEYDGTNYCGWQVQTRHKDKKSTQEVIENTLRKILQEKVSLISSGRTDAGVHALAQVANFLTDSSMSLDKLHKALNGLLPDDIAVKNVEAVDLDFHSRFSAKSKVYRYTILNGPLRSAFLRSCAYFYYYPLDERLMQREARCLLGRHDFKAFCASKSCAGNSVRTIKRIAINKIPYQLEFRDYKLRESVLILIDIEGDGFLYNMVRNIVGTLLELGRGRLPKGSLKRILLSKDRKVAGPTLPAHGLCLLRVKY